MKPDITSDQQVASRVADLLTQRGTILLVLLFAAGVAAVFWQQVRLQRRLVQSSAESEARRFTAALSTFRTMYTRDVVEVVRHQGIEAAHDFDSEAKRGRAIPLPATLSMRIGNEMTSGEFGRTRLYSKFPFPYPDRPGLEDDFAKAAWDALNRDPSRPFSRVEVVDGEPSLRYATADQLRASCVDCHNHHPESPKRDWRVGDVRGVLEVTLPLRALAAQAHDNLRESLLLYVGLATVGVLALGVVISKIQYTAQLKMRLAAIVESSDDAIIGKTLDGIVTSWNHGAESLYGYARDEMAGQSITRIVPPDRLHEIPDILATLRRGESLDHFETVRVRRDGSRVTVSLTISPINDAAGRPVAASSIARDITDRKRLEEIQRSELQFAYIASHSERDRDLEGASIIRETGDELSGIDRFDDALKMWAKLARAAVGAHQSAVSYIPRGGFAEGKHAVSMSEKYDQYKTYDVLPNGDGIWALVTNEQLSFCLTDAELKAHPAWKKFSDLRDERGLEHPPMRGWLAVPVLSRGREFVGVLQLSDKYEGDFTQDDLEILTRFSQLMAPAFSLQYANEELEGRSKALVEAKEALEQSNLQLQQFAYVASHDLQTPLRAVAGFAQFLQQDYQGRLDAQADYRIDRIVEGCKRMQKMITDLLTYSRVESSSRPFEPTDLNEVFDDAVAILVSSIQESGAEVSRSELPTVAGDRPQLSQLLQNLISNGVKYQSDRPPRVNVSAQDDGTEWIIAVRDNGLGIDLKHHDRIFELFRRLHTEEEYPGTGIGLAVCRRIVHRHGGRIWLESELGKGSTFFFTIAKRGSEAF